MKTFLIGSLFLLQLTLGLSDEQIIIKKCPTDNVDFIDYITRYKVCTSDDKCEIYQRCCENPCFEFRFCRNADAYYAECPDYSGLPIRPAIVTPGQGPCSCHDDCIDGWICCEDSEGNGYCEYPTLTPVEPDPCVRQCEPLFDLACLLQLPPQLCYTVDECGATRCLSPFSFS